MTESFVALPPVTRERAMPISPYLNGERFDPEDKRILGIAFEMVCIALRIGDSDDGVKQAIANKKELTPFRSKAPSQRAIAY